jgi:hypothetical protein
MMKGGFWPMRTCAPPHGKTDHIVKITKRRILPPSYDRRGDAGLAPNAHVSKRSSEEIFVVSAKSLTRSARRHANFDHHAGLYARVIRDFITCSSNARNFSRKSGNDNTSPTNSRPISIKCIKLEAVPGFPIIGQLGGGFRNEPSARCMCERSEANTSTNSSARTTRKLGAKGDST